MKARTGVGTGEEGPLCDAGSELLRTGKESESSVRVINGMKKNKTHNFLFFVLPNSIVCWIANFSCFARVIVLGIVCVVSSAHRIFVFFFPFLYVVIVWLVLLCCRTCITPGTLAVHLLHLDHLQLFGFLCLTVCDHRIYISLG